MAVGIIILTGDFIRTIIISVPDIMAVAGAVCTEAVIMPAEIPTIQIMALDQTEVAKTVLEVLADQAMAPDLTVCLQGEIPIHLVMVL